MNNTLSLLYNTPDNEVADKGLSETDKLKDILDRNSNKNFVKRIINPKDLL